MKDFGWTEHKIEIEKAGLMVGVDLTKPIDISSMDVRSVSMMPAEGICRDETRHMIRTTVLHTYIDKLDDHQELTITIELKSKNLPSLNDLRSNNS